MQPRSRVTQGPDESLSQVTSVAETTSALFTGTLHQGINLDLLKLKHLDFKRLNVATNADCCDPASVLGAIPQRVRNKPKARALCTAANYRCDAFLMLRSANCVSFRALHLKERATLQTLGSEFSAQVARRHCAAAIGPIKHNLLAFPQSVPMLSRHPLHLPRQDQPAAATSNGSSSQRRVRRAAPARSTVP
jgi:hypothetical protein